MNARRASTLLSLVFALSACGQTEAPPAAAAAPAASTQGTTTQQAGNPTVPLQQANPTPQGAMPGMPGAPGAAGAPGRPPMDLGGINRALGAAVAASQNATGDTDCEKAYNGIFVMVEVMQKAMGYEVDSLCCFDCSNFLRGCVELPF